MSIQPAYEFSIQFAGDASSTTVTVNLAPFLKGTPYENQIPQNLILIGGSYSPSGVLTGMSLAITYATAPANGLFGVTTIALGF